MVSTTSSWPGRHYPLGATPDDEATNFAVWAPNAEAVDLCLFDQPSGEERVPLVEQTLGIWHGRVRGIGPGAHYGFRVHGPWDPARGRRFNPAKLLLDPYARAVCGSLDPRGPVYSCGHDDPTARDDGDSAPFVPRSVVVADSTDRPGGRSSPLDGPRVPWEDTVVYEAHVKGMTARHPDVPPEHRGTFAGLAHPAVVGYLVDLGVTTVELLPVQHFLTEPALTARGLTNYWGYNTVGFFAPHAGYSSAGSCGQQVEEFRRMVGSLHAAGLEVILDVVYNHTAEGRPDGPTVCFRGYDELAFYRHTTDRTYADVTGCGNTLDLADPAVLQLVMDSLRYWVQHMDVDGFRFDLTSALTRTADGVDLHGPFLTAVGQDPVLRHVKLIAEPWDATPEGYRLGSFPPPWCEWNDRFRDAVRDFWRGRSHDVRELASRLSGSSDLYADDGRLPFASVNYVTSHDGFTLRDLVSYQHKHNEANGEGNQDGSADNRSCNFGVEGETDDPAVRSLRRRQVANLTATLLLSTGVPMLTAGDERGRTQRGNNNAFCQDNDLSYLDWSDDALWEDQLALVRRLLALRRDHPVLRQRHFLSGLAAVEGGPKDLAWFHPRGCEMEHLDWFDTRLRTLGVFLSGEQLRARGPRGEVRYDHSFLIWLNAAADATEAVLPPPTWAPSYEVAVATAAIDEPVEIRAGDTLLLPARSVVALMSATGPAVSG